MTQSKFFLVLALALSASVANAKDYSKTFSSTKEAEVEQETTYILRRAGKEDRFVGRKGEVTTDIALVNQATKAAIAKARDKALKKAYERCYDDYSNCSEVEMVVLETDISDIDTDMKEVDDGLGLEINKEVKVEAKVRIEVRGETTSKSKQSSLPAAPKRAKAKQLALPSDVKAVAETDEESEEG